MLRVCVCLFIACFIALFFIYFSFFCVHVPYTYSIICWHCGGCTTIYIVVYIPQTYIGCIRLKRSHCVYAHIVWCIAALYRRIRYVFLPFSITRYTQARYCRVMILLLFLLLLLLMLPLLFLFLLLYIFVHVYTVHRPFSIYCVYQKCEHFMYLMPSGWYDEILLLTSVRRLLEGKQIKCNPKNTAREENSSAFTQSHTYTYSCVYKYILYI